MRSLKRYAFGTGTRLDLTNEQERLGTRAAERAQQLLAPLQRHADQYRTRRRTGQWGKISHSRRARVRDGSFGQTAWSQFWSDVQTLCSPNSLRIGLGVIAVLFLSLGILWCVKSAQRCVVTLDIGNERRQIQTQSENVGQLLEQYGITLGEADKVEPPLETPVYANMRVTVQNASNLLVRVDGDVRQVKILEGTVQDALQLAGITLGEYDEVEPALENSIYPGMQIEVARVEKKREVLYETLPFDTVIEKTDSLEIGTEKVAFSGKEGEVMREIEITLRNGQEVEREQVASMVQKAQNRVILQGTGAPQQVASSNVSQKSTSKTESSSGKTTAKNTSSSTSKGTSSSSGNKTSSSGSSSSSSGGSSSSEAVLTIGGKNYAYSSVLSGRATAYTHTGRPTASGVMPSVGTVAVDPSVIPLGTRLYIPGYGFGVAQDTGGSFISGNTVDLFMNTEAECRSWGIRSVKIYILK